MSEMFDNYPQSSDYIPNNRPRCFPPHKITIMTGETATHTFEIPFDVESECSNCSVIYKIGIDVAIEKNVDDLEIIKTDCGSTVTCKLNALETAKFAHTCLDTKVQLRFVMNDGSISYSEIYNVYVTSSLSGNGEVPPSPTIITGFGYTED